MRAYFFLLVVSVACLAAFTALVAVTSAPNRAEMRETNALKEKSKTDPKAAATLADRAQRFTDVLSFVGALLLSVLAVLLLVIRRPKAAGLALVVAAVTVFALADNGYHLFG